MSIAWKLLASPALRLIDSERAHSISIGGLSRIGESAVGGSILNRLYKSPELPIEVFGNLFRHPLGLAAGFDKGAEALLSWSRLGFSWCEYGGVTRYPQEGNEKPRMFRANKHRALVNSMGFNNPGASEVRKRLIERKSADKWPNSPVAANIGRSKKVSNDQAADDYAATLDHLWEYADIFVLNISSPNTPGLRELQENDYLESILKSCTGLKERKETTKPILVKLSPDSPDEILRETVSISIRNGIDGIVASNTTVKRPPPLSTQSRKAFANNGGLSGRPLHSRALEVISMSFDESRGRIPVIGVGGIDSKDSAWEAIISGSSLIQIYSALVFNGPSVTSSIVKGLKDRVKESGFSSISEAVGYKHI
ncbi:MAG: dihydroorotate dehydrogenase (quinone) [Euryarchaeota archaeon]|nr:dihydroorotate dehydrogenase (quinone) [Euryarchaeota archaeon]|tara:strand:+ start:2431 stop:3534 length:1104 start_codon:yes stop_codon:yes gene_type:complete